MKFSKKAGSVIALAGVAALTLTSCAGGSGGGEVDGVTTVNYWSWDGAPGQDIVDEAIAAFEAEHDDIKIKYTEIPQADYKAKVAQSLSQGEDIDVLSVQPGTWAAEVEDYLLPVTDWSNGEALTEAFTDTSLAQTERLYTDEALLSVPLYLTGSAIGVYNADILDSVGIAPPTTWDEFAALSAALEAQGDGILPAVMPSDAWFQDEVALTVVGQKDPEFFNDVRYDGGKWDTESYREGLAAYKALYDDGTLDTATLDLGYGDAMTTFDEGKAAVVFNGSWETTRILSEDGNYGVIPFPAESADEASLRSFLDVTLGIPTDSTKADAAAEFIEFLSAGDGVDIWATQLKGIPAVEGYALPDGTFTTDLQQTSYDVMVNLIANPHSDRNNMGAFSDTVGADVLEVVLGRLSPEDAAEKGQQALEQGNF